jgi:hypothetical protein
VEPWRKTDAHDEPVLGLQPGNGLVPGFDAWRVKQLISHVLQLLSGGGDIIDLELDAGLRCGSISGPGVGAEARLRGRGQGPDSEVLDAIEVLARYVVVVSGQRQAQRTDEQLPVFDRVSRDYRDTGDEAHVHGGSLPSKGCGSLRPAYSGTLGWM